MESFFERKLVIATVALFLIGIIVWYFYSPISDLQQQKAQDEQTIAGQQSSIDTFKQLGPKDVQVINRVSGEGFVSVPSVQSSRFLAFLSSKAAAHGVSVDNVELPQVPDPNAVVSYFPYIMATVVTKSKSGAEDAASGATSGQPAAVAFKSSSAPQTDVDGMSFHINVTGNFPAIVALVRDINHSAPFPLSVGQIQVQSVKHPATKAVFNVTVYEFPSAQQAISLGEALGQKLGLSSAVSK